VTVEDKDKDLNFWVIVLKRADAQSGVKA